MEKEEVSRGADSLNNTRAQKISEFIGEGLPFLKFNLMMSDLREQHPDWDELPREEQGRLRKKYLGINIPLVPSMDDPELEATCLVCRDGGWVHPLKAVASEDGGAKGGLRTDYSQIIPCPKCSQAHEKRVRAALKHSGIPEARRMYNFESFTPMVRFEGEEKLNKQERAYQQDKFGEMVEAVYQLGRGIGDIVMILLYGKTGNGKTHLAYAAGLEAVARGLNVKYWYVPDMFSKVKMAINRQGVGDSPDQIIEFAKTCDFLILDDMGIRVQETDWQQAVLEEIINHRYAHKLPLVATVNKDPRNLGEAILSRFKDREISLMCRNEALDYRPKKEKPEAANKSGVK